MNNQRFFTRHFVPVTKSLQPLMKGMVIFMYYSENQLHPSKKPNMIWIFADQLRAQALGCNRDPNVHTPNIDLLSQMGIQVEGGVSGCPLCCPFRGSLITGRYPHEVLPGHEVPLDHKLPTIADVFNENQYDTAYFGKWHLDGLKDAENTCENYVVPRHRRGRFHTWIGYENNNSQYNTWVHGHDRHGKEIDPYRLPGYETDELTTVLIDYLSDRKDKNPFFAVLSVQPPHDPHFAPPEYMKNYSPEQVKLRHNVPPINRIEERTRRHIAGYYAQIGNLDWNIGRVLDALEHTNLADNTHIIIFSDHGEMLGSHGYFRKMTPYEEAIRIPVILSGGRRTAYKHGLKGGWREKVCFNHVDFAPTSLGLCGIEIPEWMQGNNHSYLRIQGEERTSKIPTSAYLQSVIPTKHNDSVDKPWRGVVTEDGWKYVCFERTEWLLFHLKEDPYEYVNLAHEHLYLNKRKELLALLNDWIEKTNDNFVLPTLV